MRKPGNQTAKFPEFSVGMGIVGLAWATKHIPRVVDAPFLLFWACTKAFSEPRSQIGQHKQNSYNAGHFLRLNPTHV
jgi:hypothetical protein